MDDTENKDEVKMLVSRFEEHVKQYRVAVNSLYWLTGCREPLSQHWRDLGVTYSSVSVDRLWACLTASTLTPSHLDDMVTDGVNLDFTGPDEMNIVQYWMDVLCASVKLHDIKAVYSRIDIVRALHRHGVGHFSDYTNPIQDITFWLACLNKGEYRESALSLINELDTDIRKH